MGPHGAAPLLFLHGVGDGARSFASQAAALCDERRVYLWEARGHGIARATVDAVRADGAIDAEVVAPWIVGHSMGGLLAMAVAAERPMEVRGLVLVDSVYAPDGSTHLEGPAARIAWRLFEPLVASMMCDGLAARTLARAVFSASFVDSDCRDRAWERQWTQVPIEYPKMMYEAFDGPTNFPNRALAREVAVPTLLFEPFAAIRPWVPQLVADLERLRDRFMYLVLDGGHYLQLDRSAARLTTGVRAFVNQW